LSRSLKKIPKLKLLPPLQNSQRSGTEYAKAFQYLGAKNVSVMDIEKREQASEFELIDRIRQADVVMFTVAISCA